MNRDITEKSTNRNTVERRTVARALGDVAQRTDAERDTPYLSPVNRSEIVGDLSIRLDTLREATRFQLGDAHLYEKLIGLARAAVVAAAAVEERTVEP